MFDTEGVRLQQSAEPDQQTVGLAVLHNVDIEGAMQTLLASASFRRAPTLHRLLDYLWRHRESDVTEYSIATEVLQRKPDFDPRIDSVVRVHILRLRQKLKEYYESEGANSLVRFSIPSGTLTLRTDVAPAPTEHIAQVRAVSLPAESQKNWIWPVVTVLLAAFAAAGWLRTVNTAERARAALPPFWAHAVGNGKPARIVLPTPVFLQFPDSSLRVRDFRLNEFEAMLGSSELKPLIESHGSPTLSQSYTVTGPSVSAAALSQYLALRGTQVSAAPEGQLALDAFSRENLIFLGIPHTSRWLTTLLEACNFRLEPNGDALRNVKPLAGEPTVYRAVNHSETRRVRPHLIALLPGKEPSARVLVLSGQSSAPATFLMSPSGLEALDKVWRDHAMPPHFEAVVLAETEGDTLVKAQLAAFRAHSGSR